MRAFWPAGSTVTAVRYNNSGAALVKGEAVMLSGSVTSLPDPANFDAVTTPEIGIKQCDAYEENFYGVCMEAIADASRGLIAIGGPAEALLAVSQTITAGMGLVTGTTLGAFIEAATPYSFIQACANEAVTTTTSTTTTCNVEVNSINLSMGKKAS